MSISRSRTRIARVLGAWLAAGVMLVSADARALTRSWPTGAAPCNQIANLQACIDAAGSGDVIEIAANAIPAQSVSIPRSGLAPKSLSLRPASGFTPVFASYSSIFALGGDTSVSIAIEGLTLARGTIAARHGGEGSFSVTFRNNKVLNTSTFRSAFEVSSGNTQPPYGPTYFSIENNQVEIDLTASDYVSAISVGGFEGGVNVGSVSGNVIRQKGGGQQPAIGLYNGSAELQVDVIGNQISGSDFNSGISLYEFAAGRLSAKVVNNVISGQRSFAGAPAGISMNVSGTNARGDFTVVNNTVAHGETGVMLSGRADLGASASALIANNIIAFHSRTSLAIDDDFRATVVNRNNLVFGGSSFFTPGPGTLLEDPRFFSATNLRLQQDSPARDAGDNAQLPPGIARDVTGGPRIRDAIVDLGAYEDGDDYLLLSEPCSGSATHLPDVFSDLGLSYVLTSDATAFAAQLASGRSWDLVAIDSYNSSFSPQAELALRDYIDLGGRVYANHWDWSPSLAAAFGALQGTSYTAPQPLHPWVPGHPLLSDPELVGSATPQSDTCTTDSWSFEPAPGARAAAGIGGSPALGKAALIVGNGGRTVLLGITPGLYPAAQVRPLLSNAIRFLLSPDVLLLDGACSGSASHFPIALDGIGLAYQHTTSAGRFDGWLTSGKDWRLVIADAYGQTPGALGALRDYVAAGGRAWWSGDLDAATAQAFEALAGARFSSPRAQQRWLGACCGPQHPIYLAANVGKRQTPDRDTCGIDGLELGVRGDGVALAGWSSAPSAGKASLISGNSGRTLIFGGAPGLYPAAEMVPLLRSALRFLLDGSPLYTLENGGPLLRSVDPESGFTRASAQVEIAGAPIDGATALARDPQSGALFAASQATSGRDLLRIDPGTGQATRVGPLGGRFAALAFDCRGTLFGVTGDGDETAPESLFRIDPASGRTTPVRALGNGDSGESLAFNPLDGRLYHGSGRTSQAFESLDSAFAITQMALSGDPMGEFRGMTWAHQGHLWATDGSALFELSTGGQASRRFALDHFAKGLADGAAACCSDPDDADCDGRPNAQDLCPFHPEANPAADVDRNGRGDECECGDANGDGKVDVSDLVAINRAIYTPSLATPLCDANGDGLCDVNDIVAANREIFSRGSTSTCGRQPVPNP